MEATKNRSGNTQIGSRDLPSADHYVVIFNAYTPGLNILSDPERTIVRVSKLKRKRIKE
jgi:hypothetical protein